MNTAPRFRTGPRAQRGVTMIVVLILMTVMLLGGIALSRMTEVSTLASGNSAFREASLQASEIGINTAYAAVKTLADENLDTGNWYFATTLAQDANGQPTVTWGTAPEITVGAYSVRYVVDRVCTGALPVTDPLRQCLVKQEPQISSSTDRERPDPPTARQFRLTVRVAGPKNTETLVQALVTKGT
jgi:type IV pilus assembly protein PilX